MRLAELETAFGGMARGDVDRGPGHAQRPPVRRTHHLRAQVEPADAAIGAHHAELLGKYLALGKRALERGGDAVAIVGMHGTDDGLAGHAVRRIVAEALAPNRRGREFAAHQVELPHAEPPGIGGKAQPRLAFLLRAQAVGKLGEQGGVAALQAGDNLVFERDIDLAGEEMGQPPRLVVDRRHHQAVPERLTILAVVI